MSANMINNLIIFNGYPLSVVVALGFHVLLVSVIFLLQGAAKADSTELVQPTIIKALFIDENPQVVNRQNLQRQRLEQEREREAAQERQRQADAERQQQEADRQRREEEQRQAALREREQLERQKAEQQQRNEERLREEQEVQRRQAEQNELERLRREELQRQQREAAEATALEAARNEFELVQSATGLIQQVVQEKWSRPPSARNGMRTVLQIQMLPTGELLDVSITSSSGDLAFDRSAENAVYKAAPFSELQSLPIKLFNANFRSLSLIFEPDDLLN
ncbi:MAG: cell envelope integrity protein TolA [Gammaproteobacteria bacterium]|nr:cell envelope integrity protein TolA [Gammaproteobacteria bacterium]